MRFKGNTDQSSARYWDDLTELYQRETRISTDDFHSGPLLPGDSTLRLLPEVRGRKALEIGCGAGQNSIFLAKQGAQCKMGSLGTFDLIHSTYALPFSADPQKVITDAAAMLKPGGTFLLTTGHPLYAGEWLDIADGEDGLFLPDYFRPEPDVRMSLDDRTMSAAHYWPISALTEWIHSAGLAVARLLEPAPMPITEMSEPGAVSLGQPLITLNRPN